MVSNVTAPVISAELFTIPLEANRYLVYAPLRRAAFVANAPAVNFLADLQAGQTPTTDAALVEFLRQLEILDAGPEARPLTNFTGDPEPTSVTLFLTTACNLRCTYCYAAAGDTPTKFMSLAVAQRGIDFVAANARKRGVHEIGVTYHGGGEPSVNWRVMTDSLDYAHQQGLSVRATAGSNGVLNDTQIDWFINNLDGVSLSFDGLPEVHDKNRLTIAGQGSSQRVMHTIRRFDEAGFRYGLRLTVTLEQIPALDPACATAPKSSLRAFKRSGSIILSVSADGQLISWSNRAERKTWSWQEGELQSKGKDAPASSSDCQGAVTPDGKLRATAKGAVIEVWSVADSRLLGTLKGHAGTVSCLVVTPDGKTLISADSNGAILIWDLDPPCFRSFLFDPQDNEPKTKGITYTRQDKVTGRTIRYTLPCGSPIPPGATCICNCVPGSYVAPVAAKPKPKPKPKPRPRRGGGRTGTVPCGSAIPPGAICTCDCMY